MRFDPSDSYDVIIAGAGPVGLFLACEVRLGGCSVLVLERERDPHAPLKGLPFGLRGLSVPSVESFDRRNLLSAVQERAAKQAIPAAAHWMRQQRRPAGHFAGIQFFHDQISNAPWPHRLPEKVTTIAADMASIEAVLAARAEALGVALRRGYAVDGVDPTAEDVRVRASGSIFQSKWLVGCDGGRSIVRKAAGITFTGTDPEFTGYSIEAELADPEVLEPGRQHTEAGMYLYTPPGTIVMADFDGGAFHRAGACTRDHVEAVLRGVTGKPVSLHVLHTATTWTDRAFQAGEYRQGRVLLAGDAAHIHSPLGGQGLNLGLGDAANLGWKLAATIRGNAPPGLLDTYAGERQPVGAQILDWSRAQVALMRPSHSSRALAAILRDLIGTPHGATYFAGRVWGVGLRYDLGESHDLSGRSAPDLAFSDGTRLNERLRSGRGLLLDFAGCEPLRTLAGRAGGSVDYVAAEAEHRLGVQAMLIRPDGIVAWASDFPADAAGAAGAMQRWFRLNG